LKTLPLSTERFDRPAVIPNENRRFLESKFQRPFRLIDGVPYKRELKDYTAAEKEAIRRTLADLIARGLNTTLKEVGFDIP